MATAPLLAVPWSHSPVAHPPMAQLRLSVQAEQSAPATPPPASSARENSSVAVCAEELVRKADESSFAAPALTAPLTS